MTAQTPSAPTMISATGQAVEWRKLLLGFSGLIIGQFMAVLDIQIVAASLLDIQAGIGASSDEIAWVQTSYLLAEVVIMPLTAYMTRLWSTQRTYLVCCAAFMVTSVLAGLSTSIEAMIAARALQGLAAGAMIPMVFAVAFTSFPVEKRVTATVVMGLIVTLAPTFGPTIGGHLTGALSWHWLFFINVPVGLLSFWLVARYGDFDKGDPSLKRGIDWIGLAAMTVGLLAIQYVIEEGAEENWFTDDVILWLTVLGVLSMAFFIWRQLTYHNPIINLRPFRNRNFSLGIVMTTIAGISLFGGVFLIPLYLGQVRRYSAADIGTTMLIGGLAMLITGPLARTFMKNLDFRIVVFLGYTMLAVSGALGAHINDSWGFWEFSLLQALRGVGVMFGMIATQQMTMWTLPPSQMKDASAIVNLMRNVGGAIGLAGLSTILTVQRKVHLTELSSNINAGSERSQAMLAQLTQLMTDRGVMDAAGAARKTYFRILSRDANVLSFADAFYALSLAAMLAAVLVFFAENSKTGAVPVAEPGENNA